MHAMCKVKDHSPISNTGYYARVLLGQGGAAELLSYDKTRAAYNQEIVTFA